MASSNKYMREYLGKRYRARMDFMIGHLGGKCVDCGSVENLEIDHINREEKSFTLSTCYGTSMSRLMEELTKCQLLCKPCHQDKTIEDLGKERAKGNHGTISSYSYCRCELCKKAWSLHMKEYNKRPEVKEARRLRRKVNRGKAGELA